MTFSSSIRARLRCLLFWRSYNLRGNCALEIVSLLLISHWRRVHFSDVWNWVLEITLFTAFSKSENISQATKASSRSKVFCLRMRKFLKNWHAYQSQTTIVKKITHKSGHRNNVVIPVFSRSSLLWATEEQDWGGQLESLSLLLYCLFPTSFVRAKVCFVFVSSLQSFSMRRARTLTSVNHVSEVFKNEKRYSE